MIDDANENELGRRTVYDVERALRRGAGLPERGLLYEEWEEAIYSIADRMETIQILFASSLISPMIYDPKGVEEGLIKLHHAINSVVSQINNMPFTVRKRIDVSEWMDHEWPALGLEDFAPFIIEAENDGLKDGQPIPTALAALKRLQKAVARVRERAAERRRGAGSPGNLPARRVALLVASYLRTATGETPARSQKYTPSVLQNILEEIFPILGLKEGAARRAADWAIDQLERGGDNISSAKIW